MPSRSVRNYKAIFVLHLFVLTVHGVLSAQHDPYEVVLNGISYTGTDISLPAASEEFFLQPLAGETGLFGDITGYGFSNVRYSRRGHRQQFRSVSLMGADLSGNLNSSAGYGAWGALRRSRLEYLREKNSRWSSGSSASVMRESYGLNPDIVPDRVSAGLFTTDRKGRMGLKASASGTAGDKWTYMADIYRRWGRDATVKGVYTDKTAYSAAISRGFGERHQITLVAVGEDSEDGLRSYITREVIELTGDNHYNPSWGYQDGKVRNSRVARGFVPVTALGYSGDFGDKFSLAVTLLYRGGKESVSGLSWLDAATPYPDYYRYLPSYASSNMAADIISDKWKNGDPSVTHIDWSNLYGVNSLNSQTSVYTLSDRVSKVADMQAFVSGSYKVDDATTIGFSVRGRSDDVRRYRRMRDLLGGMATEDIDQYLYEDEIYGGKTLNNVRQPNRKVNEGDLFGYDYDIFARHAEGLVSVDYRLEGLHITGTAGFGYTSFQRQGNFEKELYPGPLSYGRSEKIAYETYSGEVAVRYAFSPSHSMTGHVYGGRAPQEWGTHFITPTYSNSRTADASPVTTVCGEAGYFYRGRTIRASATVYYTSVRGRNELYNYWDDISSTYSSMHVRGMGEVGQGVELALDYDFHPRWNLSAALAFGSYKFSTDPHVDIYAENTLSQYVDDARTYLKGYHTGTSPENLFTTKLAYNGRGISGSLALNHAGRRYVMPSPLRRMQRAYNLALTDEAREGFLAQEKLGDTFSVDLTLLKSFKIRDGYLSFFLTLGNVLNNRNIVYGAYEQMRIARRGSGVNSNWVPFDNRYLYSYGRTYYISATWSF